MEAPPARSREWPDRARAIHLPAGAVERIMWPAGGSVGVIRIANAAADCVSPLFFRPPLGQTAAPASSSSSPSALVHFRRGRRWGVCCECASQMFVFPLDSSDVVAVATGPLCLGPSGRPSERASEQ